MFKQMPAVTVPSKTQLALTHKRNATKKHPFLWGSVSTYWAKLSRVATNVKTRVDSRKSPRDSVFVSLTGIGNQVEIDVVRSGEGRARRED